MSIHLTGGGWTATGDPDLTRPFLAEAAERGAVVGRDIPRVAFLIVREERDEYADAFPASFVAVAPCDPAIHFRAEGGEFDSAVLDDIDGLVVAGGLTPAYLEAVGPIIDEIRLLVGDGLPYLGCSAGASIAAERAIVGGWLREGVPVCPEDAAEDLDELTVRPGLGLIDVSVDAHAAQWGTLARAIAAVEAGLTDSVVAIDELTALVVGEDSFTVAGRGQVWQVDAGDESVSVASLTA
ncbi:Type 1 glutamine amidotransferase-like domain-containing protein [Galbitalea sp. SE-J8]|uniref:Type 1 glutamine amidotransferase-like domain-containing protein n=1 Tax=Galbitalea sp. SE-J8 TaxID=3054952 RepID=UPI00259CDC40|nr:Type 1 glutamine amidotransferase-like domain-containing protein [Galbitalea sp. SE-J8]MDM4764166.1 Type 1 glutamine amidotransferase-like domain-containing protein [Galbitalea sp. SE-J8]